MKTFFVDLGLLSLPLYLFPVLCVTANQVPGEHEQKADKKREHYELEHSVPTASVDDPMRKKKFLPTTLPLALLSSGPGRPAKQPKKSFDERFKELERFKQRNHHCYVPDTNNEGERSFLAEWCRNVRSKRIAVTPEQKEMLDGLRFPWEKRFDHDWNVMFEQLKAYKMKHGNCLVPWEWREDPKLSRWVHTQRKSMSKNKMREERKAVLDEIGMVWKPSETRKVGKSTQQPSFQEPPFNSYAA